MIANVVLWSNGNVSVFDEAGKQLTGYQGRFLAVRERILADAPKSAAFAIGVWGKGRVPMHREQFASSCWEPALALLQHLERSDSGVQMGSHRPLNESDGPVGLAFLRQEMSAAVGAGLVQEIAGKGWHAVKLHWSEQPGEEQGRRIQRLLLMGKVVPLNLE